MLPVTLPTRFWASHWPVPSLGSPRHPEGPSLPAGLWLSSSFSLRGNNMGRGEDPTFHPPRPSLQIPPLSISLQVKGSSSNPARNWLSRPSETPVPRLDESTNVAIDSPPLPDAAHPSPTPQSASLPALPFRLFLPGTHPAPLLSHFISRSIFGAHSLPQALCQVRGSQRQDTVSVRRTRSFFHAL